MAKRGIVHVLYGLGWFLYDPTGQNGQNLVPRRESVDYICGTEPSVQRYRIEAKIEAVQEMEMTINSNLQEPSGEIGCLDPRKIERKAGKSYIYIKPIIFKYMSYMFL